MAKSTKKVLKPVKAFKGKSKKLVARKTKKVAKKTASKQTIVSFILDETGSMESVKGATISGFNEYIGTLKKKSGDVSFTLTKFNESKTEIVHSGVPISAVNELNNESYRPNHGTPLYDALGRTILALDKSISGRKDDPAVLVVIMTDGCENASKEFDLLKINQLIKEREGRGWDFVYLGANHDAWAVARSFGLSAGNTAHYTMSNTQGVLAATASATLRYAQSMGGQRKGSSRESLFNSGEKAILCSVSPVTDIDVDALTKDVK